MWYVHTGQPLRKDLDMSKVFVGTCPDMCPEKERFMRETRKQLSIFELIPDSEMVMSYGLILHIQTDSNVFFHLRQCCEMWCHVTGILSDKVKEERNPFLSLCSWRGGQYENFPVCFHANHINWGINVLLLLFPIFKVCPTHKHYLGRPPRYINSCKIFVPPF